MQTAPLKFSFKGGDLPPVPLRPSLVVSIHDLSTVTWPIVARMLEDLAGAGVCFTSLLVIPDHHHHGRIDADPDFGAWLRGKITEGHEAVLHGFYHLRPLKKGEGMRTRLITRSYTAGEGEFFDLSFEEASILLTQGKECLKKCGIERDSGLEGFIAPAWLLGKEAERAVRGAGFQYTTRIASVIDCKKGREFSARSMVYSVRAPWRRGISLLWNELLFHGMKKAPLLRIGLHPPDWEHEAIRRHVLACIRLSAREREVTTYRKWLARWRDSVHEEGTR